MKIPFNPKNEITDSSDLFGQKVLFSQLVAVANRKSNTQLLGLRRFGKTSLFKCLEKFLKDEKNGSKVYPVFFDYKEVGAEVKGTANVYRYALAIFVSNLTKENLFSDPEIFRGQQICPSKIWEDVYIDLKNVNDIRIPGLFEEVITFFSDLLDKTVLFLFDEYEYLFRFSFDDPTGFMKLRNFASKLSSKGLNPFTFFITGSDSWEHLCSITGSPELNCIDQTIFILPINFESFKKMWEFECSFIENCPVSISNGVDYAFKASGGIPFYGKVIGSNWCLSNKRPTYKVLKSHLHEMYSSLEAEQQHILIDLVNNNKNQAKSHHLLDLIDKGVITLVSNNQYSISSAFLKEFIKSQIKGNRMGYLSQTEEITNKIEELIVNINNTHKNKKGSYIFKPVNEDIKLFRDLKNVCGSSDQFTNFSISIYHIMFERTKKHVGETSKSKATLPNEFKKNNKFINAIDIMRHSLGKGHLMDNFTKKDWQMSKSDMLNYFTGSKNEPTTPEDFQNLQFKTLSVFEVELKKLQKIVEKM